VTPAEALTGRIGGRWYGSYGTARCPVHDDRDPSLSIRDGERSVLVKCHAGCDPRDIVAALQRDRRWSDMRDPLRKKGKPKQTAEDTRRYLLSIWHECRRISGTPIGAGATCAIRFARRGSPSRRPRIRAGIAVDLARVPPD